MAAPDEAVEASGAEGVPSAEEKAAEVANSSQTVEAGADQAAEVTTPPQTEGNAEAGTDKAEAVGEVAKPSGAEANVQAVTKQAEAAAAALMQKRSALSSEPTEDEFDAEIRAKLHAPPGDTFKV